MHTQIFKGRLNAIHMGLASVGGPSAVLNPIGKRTSLLASPSQDQHGRIYDPQDRFPEPPIHRRPPKGRPLVVIPMLGRKGRPLTLLALQTTMQSPLTRVPCPSLGLPLGNHSSGLRSSMAGCTLARRIVWIVTRSMTDPTQTQPRKPKRNLQCHDTDALGELMMSATL